MQDFPSNSQKGKATDAPAPVAPREKLEPVTSAQTRGRKGGLGRKFKTTFFGGTARDAGEYMVTDVVVPAIRDMLHDALQSGIDRVIYGERTPSRSRSRSSIMNAPGHVNYSGMAPQRHIPGSPVGPQPRMLSRQARARHDFADLVIPSRQEAEEVLDRMYDILAQGGDVTVAALYELTGIRGEHTDHKWGWTSLRGAKAVRLRQGGFLLDLPEPEPLG